MNTNDHQLLKDPLITIICDNYTVRDDLEASWGFACLIRHAGKRILFDTGGDGAVLSRNMARLGIDTAVIDLVMLSHQHWDHIGGIYYILNERRNIPVCLPGSFSLHFQADMKRYGIELIAVEGAQEIFPGFYTTGDLSGPIREQAAVLQTSAGSVVITGCAHPGIVKIVQTAQAILSTDDLALVMGGFHLLNNGNDEILETISQFKAMGVRYAGASHCSGEKARKLFAREYGDHFILLGAGSMISLADLR